MTVSDTLKQIFHSILILAGAVLLVLIVIVGVFLYRYEVQPRLRLQQMEREMARLTHPVESELLWSGSEIGAGGGSMDIAILFVGELRLSDQGPRELMAFYEPQEVSLRFVVDEELVDLQPSDLDILPWGFSLAKDEDPDELWQSLPDELAGTVYLISLSDAIFLESDYRTLR